LFIDFKKVPVCKFTSEIRKFRARNPVYQGRISCAKNAQKLTCEHLRPKKFSGGSAPWTPGDGEGRERRVGGEGRGKEEKGGWEGRGKGEGKGKELGPHFFEQVYAPAGSQSFVLTV
jgi:hypothetical protein